MKNISDNPITLLVASAVISAIVLLIGVIGLFVGSYLSVVE